MTRAIVYSRVSTDGQERDGTSLESQEEAGVDYARRAGWEIIESVRDTASGFSLDRPGIARLRVLMKEGRIDVVLAYAVDRLSRNQNHIGVIFDELQGHGTKLEFVTEKFEDTATGRFILAARAFVAEVEREKIVERTTRGKTQRAMSGRIPQATGKGIYGYEYDRASGTRSANLEQVTVVERIFAEFVAGIGVSRIGARLNNDMIPAMAGGRWHPLTVRRILLNETYTGRTVYRRTKVDSVRDPVSGKKHRRVTERGEEEWIDVPDATPLIIPRHVFERAQTLLNDPERRSRGVPTDLYRLRGRVRCMTCDTPMVGQALMKGRYRYYRCRDSYTKSLGGTCDEKYVPRDLLETAVFDQLVMVLTDPERLREELRRHVGHSGGDGRRDELERARIRVQEQQKKLTRLFMNGHIPDEMLDVEATRLRDERRRIEGKLESLAGKQPAWDQTDLAAIVPELAEHVARWVRSADEGQLELLLTALDVNVKVTRQRALIEFRVPVADIARQLKTNKCLVTIEQTSASRRGRSRFRRRGGRRPGSWGSSFRGRLRPGAR